MISKVFCSQEEYDSVPDMTIQLDEYVYTVPKSSFMMRHKGICYLLIVGKSGFGT